MSSPLSIHEERPSETSRRSTSPAIRVFSLAAASFLSVCVTLLSLAAYAMPVDHIVTAVNNEVITASGLEQAVALNERLGKPGDDVNTLKSETLAGLINRRLLVQEARRLKFVEVSDQEVQHEVDRLKSLFGSNDAFVEFLKVQDLSQTELSRMVGEQLLVHKFIEKKVGVFVRIAREEAQDYFNNHLDEFPGRQFRDVQKDITARLTNARIDQQLDQYLAELRAKADIRTNLP